MNERSDVNDVKEGEDSTWNERKNDGGNSTVNKMKGYVRSEATEVDWNDMNSDMTDGEIDGMTEE